MTRGLSPNGAPTPEMAAYYRRRIEGGMGLVISEAASVDESSATGNVEYARFHGSALEGWGRVAEEVHRVGGKIFPQLWHAGPTRRPGSGPCPNAPVLSPSGYAAPGRVVGESMAEDDIERVIAAFERAARDARDLGFDGIEIHGAHGFLIDAFFWAATNRREDRWGGPTIAARAQFACELLRRVRGAVGPTFPISLRLSQWKEIDYEARNVHSPEELAQWLLPLSAAGVDIFHCSTRRFWISEFDSSPLNLAGWAKRITGKPTITVGSVGLSHDVWTSFAGTDVHATGAEGLRELVRRLELGEFDLVAVGRAVLADPNWVDKVRRGRFDELKPFSANELSYLS